MSVPPSARGINSTCPETRCSGRGTCVSPSGGGTALVCDCALGYRGESCHKTVNGSLSVLLTASVIAVLAAVLILAFIIAKMRRRQKKKRRRRQALRDGYTIAV